METHQDESAVVHALKDAAELGLCRHDEIVAALLLVAVEHLVHGIFRNQNVEEHMGDLGNVLTDAGCLQLFILCDRSLSFFAGGSFLIFADQADRLVVIVHQGKALCFFHDFFKSGLRDLGDGLLRSFTACAFRCLRDGGIRLVRLRAVKLLHPESDPCDEKDQKKRQKQRKQRTGPTPAPPAAAGAVAAVIVSCSSEIVIIH